MEMQKKFSPLNFHCWKILDYYEKRKENKAQYIYELVIVYLKEIKKKINTAALSKRYEYPT
jgi:hypothetical protein